jgi:hypothetical protein
MFQKRHYEWLADHLGKSQASDTTIKDMADALNASDPARRFKHAYFISEATKRREAFKAREAETLARIERENEAARIKRQGS